VRRLQRCSWQHIAGNSANCCANLQQLCQLASKHNKIKCCNTAHMIVRFTVIKHALSLVNSVQLHEKTKPSQDQFCGPKMTDSASPLLAQAAVPTASQHIKGAQPLVVMNGPAKPKAGMRPSTIDFSSICRQGCADMSESYSE